MGRKRKRHHDNKTAAAKQNELDGDGPAPRGQAYNSTPADAPCRLLALQPGDGVALAFGKRLRVVVSGAKEPATLAADGEHAATIRVLAFDSAGAWLLSADDSKTARLWRTADWTIAHTFTTGKKPTCGAFSLDGAYAFVADKFGDVTIASTGSGASALMLGHYCSTVSSMAVSPDGKYLATADRDNKVRVSILPADPLKGAHDIQTYCLGHTAFVTAVSFVRADSGATAIVTASGDGSVRLWNHLTGEQLADVQLTHPPDSSEAAAADDGAAEVPADHAGISSPAEGSSCQLPDAGAPGADVSSDAAAAEQAPGDAAAGVPSSRHAEDADGAEADADGLGASGPIFQQPLCPAITTLAASTESGVVAAAVEGQDAVELLSISVRVGRNCGRTKGVLSKLGAFAHPQVQLPTSLQFNGGGLLWSAGGPSSGADAGRLGLGVMQAVSTAASLQEFRDVTEAHATGAVAAAAAACTLSDAELRSPEQLASAHGQLGGHLKKKVYRLEEMEGRKRNRNDVQLKTAAVAGEAARQTDQTLS